ncbi:MAG: PA2169 family four-helix-bundle protein [Acidimicrobiia bacterium]
MSTDERVASQLTKTLENGRLGYERAAERMKESDRADLAEKFRQFASERAAMTAELEQLAAAYGDDIDDRSTIPGAVHRGWMVVKDILTGSDIGAVLNSAERGEDHALEEYREAMASDISPDFRPVLEKQMAVVQSAHDFVRSVVRPGER